MRPGVDHGLALQAAPLLRTECALAAAFAHLPEVAVQATSLALILADVAIDRRVADPHARCSAESIGHLLRAPLFFLQHGFDPLVDHGRMVFDLPRTPASAIGPLLGLAGAVGAVGGMAGIAAQFALDGGMATLE